MSQHIPEDLLADFVDGEVTENVAVHIAEHIDECPACATRAAGLEPLAAAFAATHDPIPPPQMVTDILARLDQPDRFPVPEIAVGIGLLATAAVLAFGLDGPVSIAAELAVFTNALAAMFRGVTTAMASFQVALALITTLTFLGGALTLYLGAVPSPTRSPLPSPLPSLKRTP